MTLPPTSPVLDTHALEWDPEYRTSGFDRWDCTRCGAALTVYLRNPEMPYGSATTESCTRQED